MMMDKKKVAALIVKDFPYGGIKQDEVKKGYEQDYKPACIEISRKMIAAFKEEDAEKLSELLKMHQIVVSKMLESDDDEEDEDKKKLEIEMEA